jgi:MOSC domain-containing protein
MTPSSARDIRRTTAGRRHRYRGYVHVTGLFSYPIKGCYRLEHDAAHVEPWGLAGDRRFMVTTVDGRMITQRQIPQLVRVKPRYEDEKLVLSAEGHADLAVVAAPGQLIDTNVHSTPILASLVSETADKWLSDVLEVPARLVFLDDTQRRPVGLGTSRPGDRVSFADAYPVLLANVASLDALNDWLIEAESTEWPIPMTRFRPNIVISGAASWAEDEFVGRVVRIGEVAFRATTVCDRCVVTTTDQDTGERGHEPLRTLARFRNVAQKLLFGLNLIPDQVGTVWIGDEISLGEAVRL